MTDFFEELRSAGVNESALKTIYNLFKGNIVYIPSLSMTIGARNQAIYQKFNGRNINGLSREFSLCHQQIRKIINKQKLVKT